MGGPTGGPTDGPTLKAWFGMVIEEAIQSFSFYIIYMHVT